MVILKKTRSATLIEVLVATLLISSIFTISSLTINNLLLNNLSKKNHNVETRINELAYKFGNGKIQLPYTETFENWQIRISHDKENIIYTAEKDGKVIKKTRIDGNR